MRSALALLIVFFAACAPSMRDDQREVRAAVDAVVSGLEHLDADATVAPFADDATVFFPDLAGVPDRVEGKAAIRAVFQRLFDQLRKGGTTSMTLHAQDVRVDVLGAAAVVTFHLRGAILSRRTFVLRRMRGAWRIVHLHASNVRLTATDTLAAGVHRNKYD